MTVVCLHGLRRTPADWDGVRAALERAGPVCAPAVPADPGAALATARSIVAPGDVVVGHSLGGVVALRLAAERPLRALVLTGCFFPPARNGRGVARTLADYAGHRLAYARSVSPGPSPGATRALPILARQGLLALRRGTTPPVPATTPVLVVHARDDHHVPVDFALAAVAAHPPWTAAILPRGGHHLHVTDPDAWLRAVLPWLRSPEPGDAGPPGGDRG